MRDEVIHQVRHGLRPPARNARRAEPAPLAPGGRQFVEAALAAARPREAVGQDAALQKSVKPVPGIPGERLSGAGFGMGDRPGRALLHQVVQRGQLRAVALVVDRGAIRRPLGLPTDGLHARLPRGSARRVSCRAPRLNRSEYDLPVSAHCRKNSFAGVGTGSSDRLWAASSRPRMSGQGVTGRQEGQQRFCLPQRRSAAGAPD